MIVKEKNTVEANIDYLNELKKTNDCKLFNVSCNFRIESPDGEIEHRIKKISLIFKNDICICDLIDLINDSDEKDLEQIINFLLYYREQSHFYSKLKI